MKKSVSDSQTHEKPFWELPECGCCGAAIGPCTNWPWHRDEEDCRAIRKPKEDLPSPTRMEP